MTATIRLLLKTETASGVPALAKGVTRWTPTRMRTAADSDGSSIVETAAFTVNVDPAQPIPQIQVRATDSTWCWHVLHPDGSQRWVTVPASGTVDYGNLPDVDPTTFVSTAVPEAAWWAALGQFGAVFTQDTDPLLLDVVFPTFMQDPSDVLLLDVPIGG